MSAAPSLPTLSVPERLELEACESVISAGLRTFVEVGNALLAIRDRRLYRASHSTFEDYLRERWEMSRPRAYELISAAQVVENLSENSDKPSTESHARALIPLSPQDRGDAWEEAVQTAPGGKVTAAHVRAVVDRRSAPPPPPPPASEPRPAPQPKPPGKSKVNGQVVDDPPDIARRRAAGKIPADVVPEVTTSPEPVAPPAPEPTEDDLDDEAWLATLPLSSKLRGRALALFRAGAIRYRRLKAGRDALRHHAGVAKKGLAGDDEYGFRVSQFLKLAHPRDWLQCPPTEAGGCGGTGEIPLIGTCPMCRGRGHTIDNRRPS